MSSVSRKEYQETQVLRTVSPVRATHASAQNLSQFDNNLANLLEDLQNSVSRPGSSLGQATYRESSKSNVVDTSARSNSLSRINKAPATEYSSDDAYNYVSPDGRQRITGYKKEKYMYKTSSNGDVYPEKSRMQNSITQLDNLLDDLQQAKKGTYTDSYNSAGADPNVQNVTTKKIVNRQLHYDDKPRSSSRSRTLERSEREESIRKDYQYNDETSGTYALRPTSPTPSSRTSTLSKQTRVKNIHEYPVEVVEAEVPSIEPEVLAHLDPNLRPPGNTKVTTTIKTYTYEIPGSGDYPSNLSPDTDKYVYSPNQSITTPSKSFVFNKVENKENIVHQTIPSYETKEDKYYKESTTNDIYNLPPYQKPNPPGYLVKETITTRNYQPGYRSEDEAPSRHQTYVYNENITTKNIQNGYPAAPPQPQQPNTYIVKETTINKDEVYPPPPLPQQKYTVKETQNTTVNRSEPQPPFSERGYPVYNPPDGRGNPPGTTYVIRETYNTTNRTQGPSEPQNPYPSERPQKHFQSPVSLQNHYPGEPGKTIIYKHETHTTNNTYGPGTGYPNSPDYPDKPSNRVPHDVETFEVDNYGKPKEPINIHYSYKSTNTTQNRFTGGYPPNDESQPLLPQKFPTDEVSDGPPKRLDDLMATIGNEPPNSPLNASFNVHEQEVAKQKKIDTLKRQSAEADESQKKEPLLKSKNVTGPPVYYPPGHELFATKEESEGAWRAQGGYAKASGKYQYEAESRSKSKSSSGATVVPVCLPLCCGLPCALL